MSPPWRPLLGGAEAERVRAQVERTAKDSLANWRSTPVLFDLLEGRLGLAVLFREWAAFGIEEAAEAAEAALVESVDLFNAHGAYPGLHSGFAALGWIAGDWPGAQEFADAIDGELLQRVSTPSDEPPIISLREGLAGFGLYAAHGVERPGARALADAVREALLRAARPTPEGLTWETPLWYARSRGLVVPDGATLAEAGIVHGMAAVLLALAALGAEPTILRAGLRGMWATAQPSPNRFGWLMVDGHPANQLYATSWCTGDVGVAYLSWLVAKAIGDEQIADRALDVGLANAARVLAGERPGNLGRSDLCCGVAGAMHLFTRWHQASVRPELADASRALASTLLTELEANASVTPAPGLQFGVEGISLALLALVQKSVPLWDGLFAYSWPAPRPG